MPEPLFTVVRGRLDPFETAAVTVVLTALAQLAGRRRSAVAATGSGPGATAGADRGGPWRPASGGYRAPGSWSAPAFRPGGPR